MKLPLAILEKFSKVHMLVFKVLCSIFSFCQGEKIPFCLDFKNNFFLFLLKEFSNQMEQIYLWKKSQSKYQNFPTFLQILFEISMMKPKQPCNSIMKMFYDVGEYLWVKTTLHIDILILPAISLKIFVSF